MPEIPDAEALMISVGIIGATVMPHAIYLHSGLTQARMPGRDERRAAPAAALLQHEVVIALAVAGLVNMAMVMMASAAFHAGHPDVAEIETAYHTLTPLLGTAPPAIFLLSLIASGVSEFGGRHHGRADDHAGLRRLPHSDLAAPASSPWCRPSWWSPMASTRPRRW